MSARPVYQTADGAEAAAIRQLRAANPGATITRAPLLLRVWRIRGGDGLQVVALVDGWGLEPVAAPELNARVLRAVVDDCLARAEAARKRAAELGASSLAERHRVDADRLDLRAAALLDGTEPITSSERDNRTSEVA